MNTCRWASKICSLSDQRHIVVAYYATRSPQVLAADADVRALAYCYARLPVEAIEQTLPFFKRAWTTVLQGDGLAACVLAAIAVFHVQCCKFACRFDTDLQAPHTPPHSTRATTAVWNDDHDSHAVRWAQRGPPSPMCGDETPGTKAFKGYFDICSMLCLFAYVL